MHIVAYFSCLTHLSRLTHSSYLTYFSCLIHFLFLVQKAFNHKVSKVTHKFSNSKMSLYNIYENIPETSIFNTQNTLLLVKHEKWDSETVSETEYDELEEFNLDKEYLKKIFEELYTEDTSETDSISADDDDDDDDDDEDLILEADSEDMIIEQKESKILPVASLLIK